MSRLESSRGRRFRVLSAAPFRQRGVALITVLFMFAIAVVVVTDVIEKLSMNLKSTAAMLDAEQASLLALSGEEWARQLLALDRKDEEGVDHLNESWAKKRDAFEVEDGLGYIEIHITDLQSRFNINNLIDSSGKQDKNAVAALKKLLGQLDLDSEVAKDAAAQMADWIDGDNTSGTEELDYLSGDISYRPANTFITNLSEFRLLKDIDKEAYKELKDNAFEFMTAIPAGTKLNLNTVTAEVLASMNASLQLSQAESAVETAKSQQDGFSSVEEFLKLLPKNSFAPDELVTYSEYFEVQVRAKYNDQYAYLVSVLHRDEKTGDINLISRDRGQRFIFKHSKDYNVKEEKSEYEVDI